MKLTVARTCTLLLALAFTLPALSQDANAPASYRGFNAYENLRGVVNSSGNLIKLDTSVGYDFNKHFGIFAGVPFYFSNNSGTSTGFGSITENGVGDAYFGGDFYVPNRMLDYTATLTVSAPTGNVAKGFSPGDPTVDWNNRFKHSFGRFTPFANVGIGNTVPDTVLVTRSFSSLGTVAHLEEGAEFALARRVYLGASAYHIFPFGNQQVFPRLDDGSGTTGNSGPGNGANDNAPGDNGGGTGSGNSGSGNGNSGGGNSGGQGATTPNAAQFAPSVSGNNLTRENGYDAWLGFEPTRVTRLEFGYSRSATFATNSFSFNLGLNIGRILRSRSSISNHD